MVDTCSTENLGCQSSSCVCVHTACRMDKHPYILTHWVHTWNSGREKTVFFVNFYRLCYNFRLWYMYIISSYMGSMVILKQNSPRLMPVQKNIYVCVLVYKTKYGRSMVFTWSCCFLFCCFSVWALRVQGVCSRAKFVVPKMAILCCGVPAHDALLALESFRK